MWTRGARDFWVLGLTTAMVAWGCSSGGYVGDGSTVGLSDLKMPQDLRSGADASVDLRRPVSDQLTLGMPRGYPVSSSPFRVLVYDVNGDGKLDVLAGAQELSVLLGQGDGSFRSALNTPTTGNSGLAAADVNGDGKADVVLARSNEAAVLLGKGDGTFESPRGVAIGNTTIGIALGDVNGDGKIDLAIGAYTTIGDHFVHVLPGQGDGSFGAAVKVPIGRNSQTVQLVDLNRDGKLDLVVANYESSTVSVALGLGDGGFSTTQNLGTVLKPIVVHTADMNRDGMLDLIVSSENNPDFSLHLGKGDGTFLPGELVPISIERNSYGMAVGDVNGDAVPDVVACSANNGTKLSVVLGKGDGSFFAARAFAAGNDLFSIGLGDFNADGLLDLAATDIAPPSQVAVLLNTTAFP